MRQARRVLDRPGIYSRIKVMVLEGRGDSEIARTLNIKPPPTKQAITAWRKRHAEDLQDAIERAEAAATEYAIASKLNRIADMDRRWHLLLQIIDERAAAAAGEFQGVPGMSTGLLVHRVRSIGSGQNAQVIHEYQLDAGLLTELLDLERSAAEELGQVSRPDEQVDNRTQVILREYKLRDVSTEAMSAS